MEITEIVAEFCNYYQEVKSLSLFKVAHRPIQNYRRRARQISNVFEVLKKFCSLRSRSVNGHSCQLFKACNWQIDQTRNTQLNWAAFLRKASDQIPVTEVLGANPARSLVGLDGGRTELGFFRSYSRARFPPSFFDYSYNHRETAKCQIQPLSNR